MGTSVGGSHGEPRYPDFLPVTMQYVYPTYCGKSNVHVTSLRSITPLSMSAHGNRTIRRQINSRSVESRTGQLAEMFDLKFTVNNPYKCN